MIKVGKTARKINVTRIFLGEKKSMEKEPVGGSNEAQRGGKLPVAFCHSIIGLYRSAEH